MTSRLILLGASNLTLAFPRLLSSLSNWFEGPLEIDVAHGHGRSYGRWSRVGLRALPGIVECRLWEDLASATPADETCGLVTDIGNDILYGSGIDEIVEWLTACVDRLREHGARIAMPRLPLASVSRLSSWRYRLGRSILFPGCRLTLAEVLARAEQLDAAIGDLAGKCDITLVEPERDWYWLDAIHIDRRWRSTAWRRFLAATLDRDDVPAFPRVSLSRSIRTWRLRPSERAWCGKLEAVEQPVFERDNVTVRLY